MGKFRIAIQRYDKGKAVEFANKIIITDHNDIREIHKAIDLAFPKKEIKDDLNKKIDKLHWTQMRKMQLKDMFKYEKIIDKNKLSKYGFTETELKDILERKIL